MESIVLANKVVRGAAVLQGEHQLGFAVKSAGETYRCPKFTRSVQTHDVGRVDFLMNQVDSFLRLLLGVEAENTARARMLAAVAYRARECQPTFR